MVRKETNVDLLSELHYRLYTKYKQHINIYILRKRKGVASIIGYVHYKCNM